jgi:hypothetical protein
MIDLAFLDFDGTDSPILDRFKRLVETTTWAIPHFYTKVLYIQDFSLESHLAIVMDLEYLRATVSVRPEVLVEPDQAILCYLYHEIAHMYTTPPIANLRAILPEGDHLHAYIKRDVELHTSALGEKLYSLREEGHRAYKNI